MRGNKKKEAASECKNHFPPLLLRSPPPQRVSFDQVSALLEVFGDDDDHHEKAGGGAPALLNAANEIAVAAFLARQIGFLDIAGVVADVMSREGAPPCDSLDDVIALDGIGRAVAAESCAARARAAA